MSKIQTKIMEYFDFDENFKNKICIIIQMNACVFCCLEPSIVIS